MTQHSLAPWEIEEEPDKTPYKIHASPTYQACIVAGDAAIADIRLADFRDRRTPDEARANAHLMASAPDLLAACEAACSVIPDRNPVKAIMRAAIKKAKGTAP